MPKVITRIVSTFLIFTILFVSTASPLLVNSISAAADPGGAGGGEKETWYNQEFQTWFVKVYDDSTPETEVFGERYTAAQVSWVIYGLIAFIINQLGDEEVNQCLIKEGKDIAECGGALTNALKNLVTYQNNINEEKQNWATVFTDRPISFVGYVINIGDNLNIIPEAKAQGFGFGAANMVQELWKTVRNITYFLLVLAIVIVSFMVMFRVKLSPQTVVTIQSALPKVIITLILITFSYAIAGLVIDLMYVAVGLIATLVSSSGLTNIKIDEIFRRLTTDNNILMLFIHYIFLFIVGSLIAIRQALQAGLLVPILGQTLAFIMFLPVVIGVLVLLWTFIKTLWMLLKTFGMVLLLIISAPIQLLLGVFSPGAFSNWLKNLAGNLAVYPTVGLLFLLSFLFLRAVFSADFALGGGLDDIGWASDIVTRLFPFDLKPDVLGRETTWNPPLTLGENSPGLLYLGVSFVLIVMIPRTADIIKGFISGKPFPMGTAIGEAIATGGTALSTGIGLGQARAERNIGIQETVMKKPGGDPVAATIRGQQKAIHTTLGTIGKIFRR